MTPREALQYAALSLESEGFEYSRPLELLRTVTVLTMEREDLELTLYAYPHEFVVCVLVGTIDERVAVYDWHEEPVEDVLPEIRADVRLWPDRALRLIEQWEEGGDV